MPKSKELITSSESERSDADEPKSKKSKKVVKKPADSNKRDHKKGPGAGAGGASRGDEEKKYELGKLRFIGVSEFHGKKLISIREYYTTADGETKPGKKGISLSVEQWEKLKGFVKDVDADLGGDD